MFPRATSVAAAIVAAASSVVAQSQFDATFNQPGLGSMNYRVYVPQNYQPSGPQATPVMLYLHSAAERGTSVSDIFSNNYPGFTWTNEWIDQLVNQTQTGTHQAILVMPQSGLGEVWNSMNAGDNWGVGDYTNATQKPISPRLQLAVNILNNVIGSYNADANRVYVTGPSMGGFGTWDALARFPTLFAAGAPLSGGGNLNAASTILANKPIWMYHGALDPLIPASNTDALYQNMVQAGATPIYSRVANQTHEGWDLFYTPGHFTTVSPSTHSGIGASVYDWMFAQSLENNGVVPPPAAPAPVVLDFGPGDQSSNTVLDYTASGSKLIVFNHMERANIANMNDTNGNPSGISVTHTSGTINHGGGVANPGPTVGSIFPSQATSRSFYFFTGGSVVLIFAGFDDSSTYTFDIFGGIDQSTLTGYTQYTLAGLDSHTGQILLAANTDSLLTFTDVQSLNGSFTLTMTATSGVLGYINGLRITDTTPVPEPTLMGAVAVSALGLLRRRRPMALGS